MCMVKKNTPRRNHYDVGLHVKCEIFILLPFCLLEGEILGGIAYSRGEVSGSCRSRVSAGESGGGTCGGDGCSGSRCGTCFFGFPAAYACEPAAVVFAALDVEREGHFVAGVEYELVSTVTEEVKVDLLGETVVCLQYIFTFFPRVAGLGSAGHLGEGKYDFTLDFHV